MRWKVEHPEIGDTKEVKRFLWLPRCFNGDCRWLEKAIIRYRRIQAIDSDGAPFEKWAAFMFVD